MNSIITLDKSELNSIYGCNRCYCNNSVKRNGAILIGSADSKIVCSNGCANKKYGFYHLTPDCQSSCVEKCISDYIASTAISDDGETGLSSIEPCRSKCYCTNEIN